MKNFAAQFQVDKDQKKITVDRSFAAPVDRVWAAWTQVELLDQWWAPKPYQAKTKSMNFTEGGRWLYAMISPEGEKHWSLAEYQSITPKTQFSGLDAFCDEEGNINEAFPRSLWVVNFTPNGDTTEVRVEIEYKTVEDMEKTVEMGFKEGFSAGLENLDELLAK